MKVAIILKPSEFGLNSILQDSGYICVRYKDWKGSVQSNMYIKDIHVDYILDVFDRIKEMPGNHKVILAVKGAMRTRRETREYFKSIENIL